MPEQRPNASGFDAFSSSEVTFACTEVPALISKAADSELVKAGVVLLTLTLYPVPAAVPKGMIPFTKVL